MKPSNDLFSLLKSMTGSEKRYFKLYSSLQKGGKNYIRLFDAINNCKEYEKYDENVIKTALEDEKLIKQFAFLKTYLYKLILKSLISYNNENAIDIKLTESINKCRILFSKGLYSQFEKGITSGKKIAVKYERFNFHLQFLEMEKLAFMKKVLTVKDCAELYAEEKNVIKKLTNLHEYSAMTEELIKLYFETGRVREENIEGKLGKIKESPLLKSEEMALSKRAKHEYYYIMELFSDFEGKISKMNKFAKKRFGIVSENLHPFRELTFNFQLDLIISLSLDEIKTGNYKKVYKYLDFLDKYKIKTLVDEIDIFQVKSILETYLLMYEKDIPGSTQQISRIENGLKKYGKKLDNNHRIVIEYNIARLHIFSGNYESALNYLNSLLHDPDISLRQDIEFYVRILVLLVHYELKNYDLLEYILKSLYRYLYKRKMTFKFEALILNFIRKVLRIANERKLPRLLSELKSGMLKLEKDEYEGKAFLYFDFIRWIDGKIN